MKKVFLIFQLLLVVMLAQAQMMNPVKFTSSLKTDGSAVAEIVFSGKIQPGWHVYSTGLGGDGPISASFNVNKLEGARRQTSATWQRDCKVRPSLRDETPLF